jgi:L-lysine exporter family protein LysE/ArgO
MAQYLAGLSLGLTLIMPIGAENVFIVNQGLAVGIPPGSHRRGGCRRV